MDNRKMIIACHICGNNYRTQDHDSCPYCCEPSLKPVNPNDRIIAKNNKKGNKVRWQVPAKFLKKIKNLS